MNTKKDKVYVLMATKDGRTWIDSMYYSWHEALEAKEDAERFTTFINCGVKYNLETHYVRYGE